MGFLIAYALCAAYTLGQLHRWFALEEWDNNDPVPSFFFAITLCCAFAAIWPLTLLYFILRKSK